MSKMNAVGSVWKNEAGYWDAKVEAKDHESNLCFSVWGERRMKDAMNICNIYCEDFLKWKITVWEHTPIFQVNFN